MKIKIIPHYKQAYPTVGDYYRENGQWVFYISELSKRRYEACVALHEIIECYLCWWLGIKNEDIIRFDKEYERNREEGDISEPGDDKNAPYYWQHQIATFFERIFAFIIGVKWSKYEQEINLL